jgi:hypothetical protein
MFKKNHKHMNYETFGQSVINFSLQSYTSDHGTADNTLEFKFL